MLTNAEIRSAFEAHRARVYRWAFGLCRRHEEAADAVQETFMRMIQARPALRTEGETVGWLRRVAQRVIIDRWRAARARNRHEQEASGPEFRETTELESDDTSIRTAMLDLSPQQILVVMAKFYDELTFEEIGRELGISTPTAKTHFLRAIAALRDQLKPALTGGM